MALAGAPVASAHAARIATDPAENAALTQGPQRVSATFNEELQPEFAAMTVVGPDGNLWSDRRPAGAGRGDRRRRPPARAGRHLHGELPGDVGRRPSGVGIVVVPAHGGCDRHAGPGGRQACRHRRRRDPGVAVPGGGRLDHRRRNLWRHDGRRDHPKATGREGSQRSEDRSEREPRHERTRDGDRRVRRRARRLGGGVAVGLSAGSAGRHVVRALADCAAVVTLGLAVVPMLDTGRHREELTLRACGPLAWAAGFWLFAELCRLVTSGPCGSGRPSTTRSASGARTR